MVVDRMQVEVSVRQKISEILRINIDEVTLDADLIHDLGADSLAMVDLMVFLEMEYEIDLPLFTPASIFPRGQNTVNAIADKIYEGKVAA